MKCPSLTTIQQILQSSACCLGYDTFICENSANGSNIEFWVMYLMYLDSFRITNNNIRSWSFMRIWFVIQYYIDIFYTLIKNHNLSLWMAIVRCFLRLGIGSWPWFADCRTGLNLVQHRSLQIRPFRPGGHLVHDCWVHSRLSTAIIYYGIQGGLQKGRVESGLDFSRF